MAADRVDEGAREEALKALIRQTVAEAGKMAPDEIPHWVKERIRGQAAGDLDVEAYVRDLLKKRRDR